MSTTQRQRTPGRDAPRVTVPAPSSSSASAVAAFVRAHALPVVAWTALGAALWILELAELLPVCVCALVLYVVYANLDHSGRTRGAHEYSAYSVFNKDQRALAGTLQASELDKLMRGHAATASTVFDEALFQVDEGSRARYTGPPVPRNDVCPCGSGRKYKKCCGQGALQNLVTPDDLRALDLAH